MLAFFSLVERKVSFLLPTITSPFGFSTVGSVNYSDGFVLSEGRLPAIAFFTYLWKDAVPLNLPLLLRICIS